MSISGRAALLRQVRTFFQGRLSDVVPKEAVVIGDPETLEKLASGRRHPEGATMETVDVSFGDMQMRIVSPRVTDAAGKPLAPQGSLMISHQGRIYRGDTISPSSWAGAAEFIRENYHGD